MIPLLACLNHRCYLPMSKFMLYIDEQSTMAAFISQNLQLTNIPLEPRPRKRLLRLIPICRQQR